MTRSLWQSPTIVPSLIYEDALQAAQWLTRVFEMKERSSARLSWPGGARTWMEIGDGLVNLSSGSAPHNEATPTHKLKVYIDDLDAHFHHAKAAGATIVSEPEDEFWGGRIYRARDVGGHLWEFSQRGRDLAAEDWQLPPGVKRGAD